MSTFYNNETSINRRSTAHEHIQFSELSGVTISSATTGDLMRYDGTQWTNVPPPTAVSSVKFEELNNTTGVNSTPVDGEIAYADTNVWTSAPLSTVTNDHVNVADLADADDATNPLDGHVLIGNSTHFINSLITDETKTRVNLTDIKDCNISGPVVNEHLEYDGVEWINASATKKLNDLNDVVSADPPANENILQSDGVTYVEKTPAQVGATINAGELKNVVFTAPNVGDVVEFDGVNWINAVPSGGGGGGKIYQWGANISTGNAFATGCGTHLNSQVLGGTADHRTDVIMTSDGTINILSWTSSNSNSSTEMEIYVNNVSSHTATLTGASGVVTGIGLSVLQADAISVFWNGNGNSPGNSVWHIEVN